MLEPGLPNIVGEVDIYTTLAHGYRGCLYSTLKVYRGSPTLVHSSSGKDYIAFNASKSNSIYRNAVLNDYDPAENTPFQDVRTKAIAISRYLKCF